MINTLQKLVPRRPLQRTEAFAIAEIQAQKLRQLLGVTGAMITNEHLRSIPGIIIETVSNLGVSGATRKIGERWIVLTDHDESWVRRRFTTAHEIKHILDDKAVGHLQEASPEGTVPAWFTERVCDYFAACLLMPRMWVKRAWTSGSQDAADIAELFDVSIEAARIRLQQIGLVDAPRRCYAATPDVVPLPARTAA